MSVLIISGVLFLVGLLMFFVGLTSVKLKKAENKSFERVYRQSGMVFVRVGRGVKSVEIPSDEHYETLL